MKRIFLAALTASAFLAPMFTSVPAAFAGIGPGADAPPIPDPVSCRTTSVEATATADGNRNNYAFDLRCTRGIPAIHVTGDFSLDSGAANEVLTTSQNRISANWTCPHDPWIAPSAPVCSPGTVTTSGSSAIANFDLSERTLPFSTEYLDDGARQVLFTAQLQYAANHPPAPVKVVEDPNVKANDCLICTEVISTPAPAPAPTLPDLKLATLGGDMSLAQGMTSIYSIGVSNLGIRPQTKVQVSIQVTGALAYVTVAQTPAGWDCSGAGPIICVGPLGGSGDPVQNLAVNFQVQVRGSKAGIGAISASVDPNDLIHESDETNNAKTLTVTVK